MLKALKFVGNIILWTITGIVIAVLYPVMFVIGFVKELMKPGTQTA